MLLLGIAMIQSMSLLTIVIDEKKFLIEKFYFLIWIAIVRIHHASFIRRERNEREKDLKGMIDKIKVILGNL